MKRNKFGIYLILINVIALVFPSRQRNRCMIESSPGHDSTFNITWDPGNSISSNYPNTIPSKPLCFDSVKLPLYRNCTTSGWVPERPYQCDYVQNAYDDENLCPKGYTNVTMGPLKSICILITEPQSWENLCLQDGSSTVYYDLKDEEQTTVHVYLKTRNIQEVWMPARRPESFGSVVWTIAGDLNGETVEFDEMGVDLIDESNIIENGCFSALPMKNLMIGYIRDCNAKLPILCVYPEKSKQLVQLACPKDFYTTPYKGYQNRCFSGHRIRKGNTSKPSTPISLEINETDSTPLMNGSPSTEDDEDAELITKFGQTLPFTESHLSEKEFNWIADECHGDLYTMDSFERTAIFLELSKEIGFNQYDNCLFAIKGNNVFVKSRSSWPTIAPNVSYVNWDYPISDGIYLTTKANGKWNWIQDSFNCILCEREIEYQTPELVLNFNEGKGRLYLTVYGEEFLWTRHSDRSGVKCFTNSDYELVKTVKVQDRIWSGVLTTDDLFTANNRSRSTSKTIYELKLYGDGPGYYWCQAHAIPDFKPIVAPRIVAHRRLKGKVFAMFVDTMCEKCEKLFLENYIKSLAKEFKNYLQDLYKKVKKLFDYRISIENVRVMKIEKIYPKSYLTSKQYAKILFHLTVSSDHDFEEDEENGLNMPGEQLKIYHMKKIIHSVLTSVRSKQFIYTSMNSTEYCLPDQLSSGGELSYVVAKIGEITAPRELCLLSNGLPVLRLCVGDFLYGGVWQNLTRQQCVNRVSDITKNLYHIDQMLTVPDATNETVAGVVQDIADLITNSSTDKIVPADLFYLGRVMNTIYHLSSGTNVTLSLNQSHTESIFNIYNSLMYLNENITRISAALNSTNTLLDAFDNIINDMPMKIKSTAADYTRTTATITTTKQDQHQHQHLYDDNLIINTDDGIMATHTPKLIVYVIDPLVKNISGIALIRDKIKNEFEVRDDGIDNNHNYTSSTSDDFTNYSVRLLYANQSSSELLAEENLEIAAYVPQNLLERLDETRDLGNETERENDNDADNLNKKAPDVKVIVSIYYNDVLFKEYKNVTHAKSGGKIISVSIPGYGPNLPVLLPIFVKSYNFTNDTSSTCGYWSFGYRPGWSDDGCEYGGRSGNDKDPIIMCACSHLTHFSYLILGTYVHTVRTEGEVTMVEMHQEALDLITLLGCSLSLMGIFGIVITAVVFKSWREKPSSKVLLQLSAAIGLQMILLLFINTEYSAMTLILEERRYACIALGALLHYSVLVAFCWMLITAYLQFMRYVKVLGPTRSSRFFLKSFLVGWATPLIPVLLVMIIAPTSYVHSVETTNHGICYPSGMALYLGVMLPIAMIVLANLIIFLLVIYNILIGPGGKLRTNERDLTLSQLRLSVFLFFLLGLSWIFGFLASTKAGIIFSYLFCATATIQGFVLFVYFIILDPSTRKLWRVFLTKYFCCWYYEKNEYFK